MTKKERPANILSFLGKPLNEKYNSTTYVFSSDSKKKEYDGRYASAVYFMHLKKSGKHLSKCIICGTVSSVWDILSVEYKDIVQEYEENPNSKNKITSSLSSIEFKKINEDIRKLRKEGSSSSQLREKLNKLEALFNSAFEPYHTTFSFVIHHDEFRTYTEQNSLLEDIVSNNLFGENADIYLDLTYGLRVLPFFAYAGLNCLRQSLDLKIREIVYFKEHFKTSPRTRLDHVENIKSKLRFLSEDNFQKFNKLQETISRLFDEIEQEQCSIQKEYKKTKSSVCSLRVTENYIQFADYITKFKYSGDIGEFKALIRNDNSDGAKAISKISEYLNLGYYDLAAEEVSKNQSTVMTDICGIDDYAENLAKSFFSCFDKYKTDKDNSFRKLAAFYLNNNNYPFAINSCSQIKSLKSNRTDEYKIFQYGLRSAMVHLNEETYEDYTREKVVKKFLNNLNKQNIKPQITSIFKSLEIPVTEINNSPKRKKILCTFLGAGDYSSTNYKYCSDNAESDILSSDNLKGSKVLGVSIAASMMKNKKLDQLVILGTTSSNWPVVLHTLTNTVLNELSDESLTEYRNIVENIDQNFYLNNNILSNEKITELNQFFFKNKNSLGTEILLITFDHQIENEVVQQKLINKMISNTSQNAEVYFDITHSFRIIPIICIALIVYLQSTKNIILKDIFYGTVVREDEYHLEKQQIASIRSNLFRKIDNLKTDKYDDIIFQKIMSRLESYCMDISESTFLRGNVYSMKNIVNNLNYANAISAYDKTGNLQTLETIISSQIKLTDETINKFSVGAFYDNIINMKKAKENLKEFYESFKNTQCDTILKSFKNELMHQLSWIDYSDNGLVKLALCKSRLETAMSNHNYFQALTNGYEGFKFISRCISIQLKKYINSNNSTENKETEENYEFLVNYLMTRQEDNFQKIDKNVNKKNIDVCKKEKIINNEKKKYQSFLDPQQEFDFNKNKDNNYIENEILSKISKLWYRIKVERNNLTHSKPQNKSSIIEINSALRHTASFFSDIINRHQKNNADNIELKLFTLDK